MHHHKKGLIDRIDFAERMVAKPSLNKYRSQRLSTYIAAVIGTVKVEEVSVHNM
ncbi:hypothetical protein [Paenibacillus sp. NPDC093718]|uniref:hypothetical protein n=1 Tax=Paenibacillus sp. NPDC093718 TaxID=3390601 RepID=UPI003D0042AD